MLKIAVCDDDRIMLDFVSKNVDNLLAQNGIKHTIARFLSGADFLKTHKVDPFDVVFLDIIMPGEGGFDIAKEMRGLFQKTYIIFVTTESSLVYESFDFQPFYFVPKGSPEILAERLLRVVKRLTVHLSAKKIILKASYGDEYSVDPLSIISAESSTKYVSYCFTNRPPMKIRQKLDDAHVANGEITAESAVQHKEQVLRDIESRNDSAIDFEMDNNGSLEYPIGQLKEIIRPVQKPPKRRLTCFFPPCFVHFSWNTHSIPTENGLHFTKKTVSFGISLVSEQVYYVLIAKLFFSD